MYFVIIIIISITIIALLINKYSKFENKISNVFVINLIKRKERLAFFASNYNLKIPFEIFNAIDGTQLNLSKLISNEIIGDTGLKSLKNKTRKYHYELTNLNSVGRFLSHYYLWKQILNMKGDNFLIFEDDTIFNSISLYDINYRISILPDDWNIYLLSNPKQVYQKTNTKVHRFFLTNAYIINKKGINKILDKCFPINQQLDSFLSDLTTDNNLNIYIHDNYKFYNQSRDFITDIQDNSYNLSYERFVLK